MSKLIDSLRAKPPEDPEKTLSDPWFLLPLHDIKRSNEEDRIRNEKNRKKRERKKRNKAKKEAAASGATDELD